MKACPFCKGRATKLLSISTGLVTCQQCGQSYPSDGSSVVGTLSLLNSLIDRMRGIRDDNTSCGRMHACASAERLVEEIKNRITQASDAVARPVSSKQGLSIRDEKRTTIRGYPRDRTRE